MYIILRTDEFDYNPDAELRTAFDPNEVTLDMDDRVLRIYGQGEGIHCNLTIPLSAPSQVATFVQKLVNKRELDELMSRNQQDYREHYGVVSPAVDYAASGIPEAPADPTNPYTLAQGLIGVLTTEEHNALLDAIARGYTP